MEYNQQINFSIDQEMAIFVGYDLQWTNRINNDGLTHHFFHYNIEISHNFK